ncbi:MAG: hypothetical protein EZS28_019824 [Streblomastix strix]|uniref:Uncharacterized protein n=1 Tax=Streblomastix strix TaxID=222440 RepID=A0A5J4VQ95_9EUKA|nr:MAG: hypothetical protein EZS28_019824 [Streblomastix strix]
MNLESYAEDENLFDFERVRVKCGAILYSFCEEDDRIRSDEDDQECGVQSFALFDSLTFDGLSFNFFGVEGQFWFCFEGDEDDYYEDDLLLLLELFLFVDLLKLYIQSSL